MNSIYSSLSQTPEPLYMIGMDNPISIFALIMGNSVVSESLSSEGGISNEVISEDNRAGSYPGPRFP